MAASTVSGKKIVLSLFAGAAALCGILFYAGLKEKRRRIDSLEKEPVPTADTLISPAEVKNLLDSLPQSWTRITRIQGQGWVVFVPCDAQAGSLLLSEDSLGQPALQCEFCDTLEQAPVLGGLRPGSRLEMDLGGLGKAAVDSVTDSVAARFQGAPVKGHVLTWIPVPGDTLAFVPENEAGEFEVLRAEDESPEGCGGEDPP
jgi:hypothetical protein